jgi:hypothetical protein
VVDDEAGVRPGPVAVAGQGWLFWKALRTAGSRSEPQDGNESVTAARTKAVAVALPLRATTSERRNGGLRGLAWPRCYHGLGGRCLRFLLAGSGAPPDGHRPFPALRITSAR